MIIVQLHREAVAVFKRIGSRKSRLLIEILKDYDILLL